MGFLTTKHFEKPHYWFAEDGAKTHERPGGVITHCTLFNQTHWREVLVRVRHRRFQTFWVIITFLSFLSTANPTHSSFSSRRRLWGRGAGPRIELV